MDEDIKQLDAAMAAMDNTRPLAQGDTARAGIDCVPFLMVLAGAVIALIVLT